MNWESSIVGWEHHSSEDGQPLLEARGGDQWFLWKAYKDGFCSARGWWIGRRKNRDAAYQRIEDTYGGAA
jgi:hypothetical protein